MPVNGELLARFVLIQNAKIELPNRNWEEQQHTPKRESFFAAKKA